MNQHDDDFIEWCMQERLLFEFDRMAYKNVKCLVDTGYCDPWHARIELGYYVCELER